MSFRLEDYNYFLPPDLIAQAPVEPRDSSRLLVIDRARGSIEHRRFLDLPSFLDSSDVLVANNTEVIRARLVGKRLLEEKGREVEGGKIEFLMLEEVSPLCWEGAFHAAAKHKPGVRFLVPTPDGRGLRGELIRGASESESGTVVARFDRDPIESGAGEIPLPHYIDRAPDAGDDSRYQTVYASSKGSAAAPTAGLHFTPRVLDALRARGVAWEEVTLHVGLGTFRPVKTDDIRAHVMHEERYSIAPEVAERLNRFKSSGRRVVAVGTTAVRTLEGAWRAGVGAGQGVGGAGSELGAVENRGGTGSDVGGVVGGVGRTKLFIHPDGRGIHFVDRMITNFHLPKSTLLMLVSAFAGRELVLEAYRQAVAEKYRFFSYGDSMLIL